MELKRESVIALHLKGEPQVAIVRALQHLNVNKSFVSRTIARYRETGSVASRPKSSRKKTVTTPEMIQRVKAIFDENPSRSARQVARELNISRERMQHILQNELGLQPVRVVTRHESPAGDTEPGSDKNPGTEGRKTDTQPETVKDPRTKGKRVKKTDTQSGTAKNPATKTKRLQLGTAKFPATKDKRLQPGTAKNPATKDKRLQGNRKRGQIEGWNLFLRFHNGKRSAT